MEYVSIRVSTLRGDQPIEFDVYVKINDKMILYLRRGDSFEGGRLRRLKDKKLKKMFIHGAAEAEYRSYMQRNIEMAYDNKSGKDIKTRAEIIQGTQQSQIEAVFENPDDDMAYVNAKESAARYVDFILSNEQALNEIISIDNIDGSLAHHGVNVATYAVAMSEHLGKNEPKNLQMLTLGALLHDFGHFNGGQNLKRPLSEFTDDELKIYKDHVTIGSTAVQDKKHFDQAVVNIIAQHEELSDGSGFPKGLKEHQIDPLALIVSSANTLDRMISFEGVAKADAGKSLIVNSVGKHPLNHLQILSGLLK